LEIKRSTSNFDSNNKKINLMNYVNAFQKIALSLGVLFFGIGVFIYAISPAQADSPTTTNSTGKIMMSESGFVFNNKAVYNVLVWDTETGKSKIYAFNATTLKMITAEYQIPASPLY
jgi:hypothetical protein